MINIVESKPRKVSGLSSFLITFNYNPVIIDAIKTLPTFYYHKKDYTWEIPCDLLTAALETLTFLDDIKLTLLPDEEESKMIHFHLTPTEIDSFRVKPFEHQIDLSGCFSTLWVWEKL